MSRRTKLFLLRNTLNDNLRRKPKSARTNTQKQLNSTERESPSSIRRGSSLEQENFARKKSKERDKSRRRTKEGQLRPEKFKL